MSKRNSFAIGSALAASALAVLIGLVRAGSVEREKDETSSAAMGPASAPGVGPPRLREGPLAPPPALATIDPPLAPSTPPALTDEKLMEELRHARTSALAIPLAREGNRQFPDSAFAPERESILIHALADNEQPSEARGEAEYMVNHYPDSAWLHEIERFTGAHRHRNLRLSDAGELESD